MMFCSNLSKADVANVLHCFLGLVNLCRSDRSLSGGSNHRVAEEIQKAQPMCFVFNRAGLDVVSASRWIAQYLFRA